MGYNNTDKSSSRSGDKPTNKCLQKPLHQKKRAPPLAQPKKCRKCYPALANQYELIEKVGSGGYAVVYKAKCLATKEIVAVKCIDLDRKAEYEQLVTESQTLMLVSHPNILSAHCAFVVDRALWVVMPFMAVGSVRHILKTSFPSGMEESVTATILHEVLKGLDYLHRSGHIHRDVKAANILVDIDGAVKLADFGLSAFVYENPDRTSMRRKSVVGTLCWMAPEVMYPDDDVGYDWKADIWSFGITAMELANGDAPFMKHEMDEIGYKLCAGSMPKLNGARFSKSFKDMVSLCLQADQEKRPSTQELLTHPFFKIHAKTPNHILRNVLLTMPLLAKRVDVGCRDDKGPPAGEKQEENEDNGWDFNV